MEEIFGSQKNFEEYRISRLLQERAKELRQQKRLGLMGYANFREHHQVIHQQMQRLQIPHEYHDVRLAKHTWDAGWLAEAVRFLAARK
jgi:hypothetical protein